MVFGNEYDRSLWLILAKDKVNQEYIARMINNIPYEKWDDIRLLIQNYNNGINNNGLKFNVDNLSYAIIMCDEELSIKVIEKDGDQESVSEWTFMPLCDATLEKARQFSSVHLGSFSETMYIDDKTLIYLEEYDVFKTPIGNYVKLYRNNENKSSYSRRVDIKKMPKNMYVHQFSSEQRINRLVRRKRK